MLSYILPVEEKPPASKERLQLELSSPPPSSPEGNGRRGRRAGAARPPVAPPPPPSIISKESSTSSFASSDLTTGSSMTPTGTHEKPKHKLLTNGTKHTGLKRVSFGSSKGSMVETLIYESPLAEEPEASPAPTLSRTHETCLPYAPPVVAVAPTEFDSERSKVRVSFYQGARPQCVSPPPSDPEPPPTLPADMAVHVDQPHLNRQISTESGWDNPFRPDGDLSREADEIVSLIKGGKPITPTPHGLPALDETDAKQSNDINESVETATAKAASPALTAAPRGANGTKNGALATPGPLEVQLHPQQEPQQAEHVVIKKKPKCECCVLQ